MAGTDAFKPEGVVVDVLSDRTYRVELANGHRLLGFTVGRATAGLRLACGERVRLQLTPFDLSSGRILGQAGVGKS